MTKKEGLYGYVAWVVFVCAIVALASFEFCGCGQDEPGTIDIEPDPDLACPNCGQFRGKDWFYNDMEFTYKGRMEGCTVNGIWHGKVTATFEHGIVAATGKMDYSNYCGKWQFFDFDGNRLEELIYPDCYWEHPEENYWL